MLPCTDISAYGKNFDSIILSGFSNLNDCKMKKAVQHKLFVILEFPPVQTKLTPVFLKSPHKYWLTDTNYRAYCFFHHHLFSVFLLIVSLKLCQKQAHYSKTKLRNRVFTMNPHAELSSYHNSYCNFLFSVKSHSVPSSSFKMSRDCSVLLWPHSSYVVVFMEKIVTNNYPWQ